MNLTVVTKDMQLFWQELSDHQARICRIFGNTPDVMVPDTVEGHKVTSLADYCFAQAGSKQKHFLPEQTTLRELSGSYVQSVTLPATLTAIGNYCFFDCRKLSRLRLGRQLTEIGSDAFMNCYQLQHLYMKGAVQESSGLRQILNQISWDLEVLFQPDGYSKKVQAAVFFPEYFDTYDEIAPAHIFGRNIAGEGFRARQSIHDGKIDFAAYDQTFQKACAEESIITVCKMAGNRLRYPYSLSETMKNDYQSYLTCHGGTFSSWLIQNRDLDMLSFLYREKILTAKDAAQNIQMASEAEWAEGSASMMRWKHTYYPASTKERYRFS